MAAAHARDAGRTHGGASPRQAGLRARSARRLRRSATTYRSGWIAATIALVLAGVTASALGARAAAHSTADKQRLSFRLASVGVASTLELSLQREEDLVTSASAYVSANRHGSPADFDRWLESVKAMQRYPELQNIGLVQLVRASRLAAFERSVAQDPLRPFGPTSAPAAEPLVVMPAGQRPYYCFAAAGMARGPAHYIPVGTDYCAIAPALAPSRDTGQPSYAPFVHRGTATLGIQTPVYRGGVTPSTPSARRRLFQGWLGELLVPGVILRRALQSHPNVGVMFHYGPPSSRVTFSSGAAPAGAQTATIDLHNGWNIETFGPRSSTSVSDNGQALMLLVGGSLLSVLLGVLLLVLGTGRRRARALVRARTRELSHQALHDALTGLPNRALVLDRAKQMLARVARQPEMVVGALFIDIDGFKRVNDNLGHASGDRLLEVAGERLQGTVREQDTVGRLGGDEFVVLVESLAGQSTIDVLADRLTDALRQPVELGDVGRTYSITASIGGAMGRYATPDDLLRDADLALYAAKGAGRDRYTLFDASMNAGAEARLELETDLSSAVQRGQLFLLYQPIFELASRRPVMVEALARWQHPTRGVVPPDSFIPLAEESGLIAPIDRWVLQEACLQASAWAADGVHVGISVNVSAYQLDRTGFVDDVRDALASSAIDPASLTLEITETTLMRDVHEACARLQEIKALGVRVAIDDFGIGYASLSQLQRMPIDILKIDRSFVAALADGRQSRELLEAIVGVGRSLSLTVIAEGVEEHSQQAILEQLGCGLAQGFLLGHPCSAVDVVEQLFEWRAHCQPAGSPAR
jgi:diguanylate cyclase (GGDEF)-like protein